MFNTMSIVINEVLSSFFSSLDPVFFCRFYNLDLLVLLQLVFQQISIEHDFIFINAYLFSSCYGWDDS